jgi:hypothetical protein
MPCRIPVISEEIASLKLTRIKQFHKNIDSKYLIEYLVVQQVILFILVALR